MPQRKRPPLITRALQIDAKSSGRWSPTLKFKGFGKHSLLKDFSFAPGAVAAPSASWCELKDIDVKLKEVRYQGDDLGIDKWKVEIDFQVAPPHGESRIRIPGLPVNPRDRVYDKVEPIYFGKGVLCGPVCPDSALVFEVRVQGRQPGGQVLGGETDALFQYKPSPQVETLSVDARIAEPGRNPKEAKLQFLFTVTSAC